MKKMLIGLIFYIFVLTLSVAQVESKSLFEVFDRICSKAQSQEFIGEVVTKKASLQQHLMNVKECCLTSITIEKDYCLLYTARYSVPLLFLNEILEAFDEHSFTYSPTVVGLPDAQFNRIRSASQLRTALIGWGTDEETLIKVVTSLNAKQRRFVAASYKQQYGDSLITDIKDDISNHFQKAVTSLFLNPAEHDAFLLKQAAFGFGTNERVFCDVIAALTPSQLVHAMVEFERIYSGTSMSDIMLDEMSGSVVKLFDFLLKRVDDPQLRWTLSDAEELSGDQYSEERHVKQVFEPIMLGATMGIEYYFAQRIRNTLSGIGTDDCELIGLIVSRTERDLERIKTAYEELYGETLQSSLNADLSGDYRRTMNALL